MLAGVWWHFVPDWLYQYVPDTLCFALSSTTQRPSSNPKLSAFLSYWHSRGHSHLYSNGQKGWDGMARLTEQKETRKIKKKKGKDKYRTSLRGRKSEPKDKGGSVTAILTLFLYRDMSKARRENKRFLYLVGSYVVQVQCNCIFDFLPSYVRTDWHKSSGSMSQ